MGECVECQDAFTLELGTTVRSQMSSRGETRLAINPMDQSNLIDLIDE
jgi:hypothetical protein